MYGKFVSNERGLITIDFIFAFVLVFSLTILLFALSLTLSVIEITQYITFASARNYFAAHVSQEAQTDLAKRKFDQLVKLPVFRPLFKGEWFRLSSPEVGREADQRFQQEYPDNLAGPTGTVFAGVRVTLTAKVLEMRIPFFGPTFDQEDGFTTRISTFLAREPSTQECVEVTLRRYNFLRTLDPRYATPPEIGYADRMGDNGC